VILAQSRAGHHWRPHETGARATDSAKRDAVPLGDGLHSTVTATLRNVDAEGKSGESQIHH
jgi:hypothetical protein